MCEERYWSVSVCTMLVWPVDQTSFTCPDLTLDTSLPPSSPQDSHSEVQIYDLRLCYPPHLTRRAIIASNTNTQRSDQVALI